MALEHPSPGALGNGQVVLITGCSSGIGLATAKAYLETGFSVVATSRDPRSSRPLSDLQAGSQGRLTTMPLDVREDVERDAAVNWVRGTFGRLDVLVNNAGLLWTGKFENADHRQFESVIQTNVVGPMDLTRRALPYLEAAPKGRVINVSAIGGVLPAPFLSLYVAAKHALEGMSASLDIELAPRGVRVLTLLPGLVRTSIVSRSRGVIDRQPSTHPDDLAEVWLDELEQRIHTDGVDASEVAEQIVALTQMADPPQKSVCGTSRSSIHELVKHLLKLSGGLRTDHEAFVENIDRAYNT